MNGAIIKGFEEDVGSRTSVFIHTAHSITASLYFFKKHGYTSVPKDEVLKYKWQRCTNCVYYIHMHTNQIYPIFFLQIFDISLSLSMSVFFKIIVCDSVQNTKRQVRERRVMRPLERRKITAQRIKMSFFMFTVKDNLPPLILEKNHCRVTQTKNSWCWNV